MNSNRRISYLIIFITVIQFGCSNKMSAQGISQGIKGKVIWLQGNMMPMIGDNEADPQSKEKPVKREIYIYVLTNTAEVNGQDGFYTSLPTQLVKKVETDDQGNFSVSLEPGKYSVFVKEEQGLWANIFDGQGNIMPVAVDEDEITDIKIEINYKAAY